MRLSEAKNNDEQVAQAAFFIGYRKSKDIVTAR